MSETTELFERLLQQRRAGGLAKNVRALPIDVDEDEELFDKKLARMMAATRQERARSR